MVEETLAFRGINVSYETDRQLGRSHPGMMSAH